MTLEQWELERSALWRDAFKSAFDAVLKAKHGTNKECFQVADLVVEAWEQRFPKPSSRGMGRRWC